MKVAKLLIGIMLIASLFSVACNNKQQTSKAIIIERKTNQDSLLTIIYAYEVKGKLYTDSIKLKNKIITSDTVCLIFSEKKPKEHQLELP